MKEYMYEVASGAIKLDDPRLKRDADREGCTVEEWLAGGDFFKCEYSGDWYNLDEEDSDLYEEREVRVARDHSDAYRADNPVWSDKEENGTHNFARSGNAYGGFSR